MQARIISERFAPGVYQIRETSGTFTSKVDRMLADGTMLSAPENEHLLVTIDTVISSEYPSAPATVVQKGARVPGLISSFGILVQWMKARGIHYFAHLTVADMLNFIEDCSCGLDAVVRSQQLLLEGIQLNHRHDSAWLPNFPTALDQVGIPSWQCRYLPAARSLWLLMIDEN